MFVPVRASVPAPALTIEFAVAPLPMAPPRVSVAPETVIVRAVPAPPSVLAPAPRFRSFVPVKVKSALIVSG